MFSNGNIDTVLKEGRTWVSKLDNAVKATETKVKEKDKEIAVLNATRKNLNASVDEGKKVANNFKKMLEMK